MCSIAMEYLCQDQIKHMDMISPIKRGTAAVLYADKDNGVLLHETKSGAYMMSVTTHEVGEVLLRSLPGNGLFVCHQDFMLADFEAKIKPSEILENFQGAYFGSPLKTPDFMDFKPLTMGDLTMVQANYDMDLGEEYLAGRIADGELFGGYENGEMIGFIGIHAEGSMGMLRVFDNRQGKGYGAALYTNITNFQLGRGLVPFGQISTHNPVSMHLARKLGFEIGGERVWWLS